MDDAPSGRCPVCDRAAHQTERYPRALCPACAGRATDLRRRPVDLGNEALSGGMVARHCDDGSFCEQVTGDGRVLIDDVEHRAGEARFGGIVVEPVSPPPSP